MLLTEEIELAANADVLLTKNRIVQAVYQLFGRLADAYRNDVTILPEPLIKQHPKIAKGENYLGLPWVMLDYPRNFGTPDILAVRTMFWWGNHFSLQLLLQGACLKMLNEKEMMQILSRNDWFFCTGNTPWQHHFSADYMQPVLTLTPELIHYQKEKNGFFKIGVKLPVTEWEKAETFLKERFLNALRLIS